MKYQLKFITQIIAAVMLVFLSDTTLRTFGDILFLGPLTLGYLKIPVTVFCVIGVVNAINMTDGLDGLAGGISLIAFITFAILAYINHQRELMLLSIALSGAVIGFLRYNWYHKHPFHLFMGDMGSFLLGFSLAFLSIAITQKSGAHVYPVAPLLILAVPVVDTVTVMIRRKMKGKSPFHPDKGHFHHILLRFGLSKKDSVKVILILTAMFSTLSVVGLFLRIPDAYLFIVFLLFFTAYFTASFYLPHLLRYKFKKIEKEEFSSLTDMVVKVVLAVTGLRNRRFHKRYDLHLPFSIQMENQKGAIASQSLDIGTGGLSAKLPRNLFVGDKVKVDLFIHKHYKRKKISSCAKIVWAHPEEGTNYRYGLEFTEIERNQFYTLRHFLQTAFEGHYNKHRLLNEQQHV
jgi:UDP-GlcNAc:undecaprenyl-phosphate GlcNAc-1-phosphate transferase